MGMDVHGLNPVIHKETSEYANVETRELLEADWTKLSKDDLGKYFEAKQQYEEDNPGIYFRNNVWWWRPLWDYVWKLCGDCDEGDSFALAADRVITQEQYEEGHMNSGAEINVHQAELIALRLNHAIKMGWVENHKKQYEADTKDDEHQYPFHEDNVKAFAEFCKDSGGFSIQ
mgnify:CR=1 FL=1